MRGKVMAATPKEIVELTEDRRFNVCFAIKRNFS
jgi:hypothetical protein